MTSTPKILRWWGAFSGGDLLPWPWDPFYSSLHHIRNHHACKFSLNTLYVMWRPNTVLPRIWSWFLSGTALCTRSIKSLTLPKAVPHQIPFHAVILTDTTTHQIFIFQNCSSLDITDIICDGESGGLRD